MAGVAVSNPTTSSMPASVGSAIVNGVASPSPGRWRGAMVTGLLPGAPPPNAPPGVSSDGAEKVTDEAWRFYDLGRGYRTDDLFDRGPRWPGRRADTSRPHAASMP
jgi:hypothetical protein